MTMPHRLFGLLALVLAALLPWQASHAAVSCAPMQMAMEDTQVTVDCGGCPEPTADACRSLCVALCQSLTDVRSPEIGKPDLPCEQHVPFSDRFPATGTAGPEPPPPRLPG